MKIFCFKNILDDLLKHKIGVFCFMLLCMLVFAVMGYKTALSPSVLTEEQQTQLNEYQEKIAAYDAAIADATESLALVDQQISDLQNYIDHSIYMKLDGQNVQVASAQYEITSENHIANILNILTFYINEGGLKQDAAEPYAKFQPEYWREIISCSANENILNITVLHYDAGSAEQIMNAIDQLLQKQIPSITAAEGAFTLSKITSSLYTKADVNITNTQNNHRNNLKGYTNSRIDQSNKLLSQQNNKRAFIEDNKPNEVDILPQNPASSAIKFAIAGLIFGIILPSAAFMLHDLLGNRIRSVQDLEAYHLHVLNPFGRGDHTAPDFEQSILNICCLAKRSAASALFLSAMTNNERITACISDYSKALTQNQFQVFVGYRILKDSDELKNMADCQAALLVVQLGKTTYPDLEKQLRVFKNFEIPIIGCLIVK